MKKYGSIFRILSLACACLISVGCATNQPGAATAPPNSGHLLVYRVPNFGTDLFLVVSVDGKVVGRFGEGRYYDGYLPAREHRLTARVDPNPGRKRPGRKTVTVQAGQTFAYSVGWSGEALV